MIEFTSFNLQNFTWKDSFPGVYMIECAVNGKYYIGSSIDVPHRLNGGAGHLYHLKRGTHHNKDLQKDFNLYGQENFRIGVMEIAESMSHARRREQWYLDLLNRFFPEKLYNIAKNVEYYQGEDRKISFQIISPSGEVISFCGVKDFCRKNNLDYAAIGRVLRNPSLTYKGWKNVGYYDRKILPPIYRMDPLRWLDKNGEEVSVKKSSFEQYCVEHGYCEKSLKTLAHGRRKRYKDLWMIGTSKEEIEEWERNKPKKKVKAPRRIKGPPKRVFQLISPEGEIVTITGMNDFCEKNNLWPGGVDNILKNPRCKYKGWTSVNYIGRTPNNRIN